MGNGVVGLRTSTARTGRRTIGSVVGVLAITIGLVGVAASPASAQADPESDQRVVSLDASYDINTSDGGVDVSETITVRNVKGSVRGATTVTSFYWTGHTIWVPGDAEDLAILSNGDPLEFEVAETIEGIDILTVDYPTRLTFGQTRVLDVSYRLPTYSPDSGPRRINDALFDLEIIVCCNFEEVNLSFTAPPSFDVLPPDNLRFTAIRGETGTQRFEFSDNETTGQFTDLILMQWFGLDEAGMTRQPAAVGASSVDVVAPPDDTQWIDGVGSLIEEVGPELVDLTGNEWPATGIEIVQGPNPDLGPLGLAVPASASLSLPRGYEDRSLSVAMAQQLLANGPFTDADVSDGLAADLGVEALRRSTGARYEAREPVAGGRLSDDGWLWLMQQVSAEVGYDGMTELLRVAGTDETAYVGDGEPEALSDLPADWRRFVDIAERRVGATGTAELFAEYALDDDDQLLLSQRGRAITAYDGLVDQAGVAPVGLRDAMTNWDFDRFNALLPEARSAWSRIEDLSVKAESADQGIGAAVEDAWAGASSDEDFTALGAVIDDRESELDRNALGRILLFGAVILALIAAVAFAAVFLSRRRQKVTVDDGLAAQPGANPPFTPVGVGVSSESQTVVAQPSGQTGPPMPPTSQPSSDGGPPMPPGASPSPPIPPAPSSDGPPMPPGTGGPPMPPGADGSGRSTVALPGPPEPPHPPTGTS